MDAPILTWLYVMMLICPSPPVVVLRNKPTAHVDVCLSSLNRVGSGSSAAVSVQGRIQVQWSTSRGIFRLAPFRKPTVPAEIADAMRTAQGSGSRGHLTAARGRILNMYSRLPLIPYLLGRGKSYGL